MSHAGIENRMDFKETAAFREDSISLKWCWLSESFRSRATAYAWHPGYWVDSFRQSERQAQASNIADQICMDYAPTLGESAHENLFFSKDGKSVSESRAISLLKLLFPRFGGIRVQSISASRTDDRLQ